VTAVFLSGQGRNYSSDRGGKGLREIRSRGPLGQKLCSIIGRERGGGERWAKGKERPGGLHEGRPAPIVIWNVVPAGGGGGLRNLAGDGWSGWGNTFANNFPVESGKAFGPVEEELSHS